MSPTQALIILITILYQGQALAQQPRTVGIRKYNTHPQPPKLKSKGKHTETDLANIIPMDVAERSWTIISLDTSSTSVVTYRFGSDGYPNAYSNLPAGSTIKISYVRTFGNTHFYGWPANISNSSTRIEKQGTLWISGKNLKSLD